MLVERTLGVGCDGLWVACTQAGRACGRSRYRGCRARDKHASGNKVSLNGLTVALFRVGGRCCSWGVPRSDCRVLSTSFSYLRMPAPGRD